MKIFKELLNILFPEHYACLLCGKEVFYGEDFCADCDGKIIFNDGMTCPVCGRRTSVNQICLECKDCAPVYDKAVSATVYQDGARDLILKFKNDCAYLKNYLALKLYEKCKTFTDADGICFVPMTAKSLRKRGYNQAELLALELAKMMNLPVIDKAIEKVRQSKSQKTLTRNDRIKNLSGCFSATNVVKGKTLIVVDDVLTTGATAEAVCTELKKHGAKKLYFATVASVELNEDLY